MEKNNSGQMWVHFVGIGGAGMSALAQLALNRRYKVTGSDIKFSSKVKKLMEQGTSISLEHKKENVQQNMDSLVYSSCIPKDNIELLTAQKLNIPIFHRSEFLAQLMNGKYNIAVCGSHGKTTTSSLIYHILHSSDFDVSAAIGGSSYNSYDNIERDTSYFVAEADESDGSFVNLTPDYIVLTNLDKDHFDFYNNFNNMLEYFNKFLRSVKDSGCIFINECIKKYEDKLLKNIKAEIVYFGIENGKSSTAEIKAVDFSLNRDYVKSKIRYLPYFEEKKIKINLLGKHNLQNVIAAVGLCTKLGVKIKNIKRCLKTFKGVRRRFQVRLKRPEYKLIEDYAHHPTEIKATIETVRKCYNPERIIGIFQPHRYTRTKLLARQLGDSLRKLDILILTSIYAANEDPIPGVNVKNIYDYAVQGSKKVTCLPKEDICSYLINKEVKKGDLILVLGAGDISTVAKELEEELIDK